MTILINNRELNFQLYENLAVDQLIIRSKYTEHSKETFDAVLDTAEKIATKYFLPHNQTADQNEPQFIEGKVKLIPEVKAAYDAFREAGFIASSVDFDEGGMQLPFVISLASAAYFNSANPSTMAYGFLTAGAANLIRVFASDDHKQAYLPKMLTGEYSGTMALTEPNAGSSLADIVTQAEEAEDGSYRIKGQKIFISAGDHELSDNIIHLVLAKIKGAPAGVKGISLFIVPKYRLNEQGEVAEPNDVELSGLFHKMGYRGTTSTILNFGEKNDCHGYLVGEPHHGLKYMFQMMNEARLQVGFGAACIGYRGYMESLAYAKERPQGRSPSEKKPQSQQINIIEHADVKRMLLAQKAYVEGGMSLCFYAAMLVDDEASLQGQEKQNAAELLDLLMPIVKASNSDYGLKANELAIQVLGGSGYTKEYPVEQCYRDNRLNPIHEGTNGIQALDLLGRKVWQNNSRGLGLLTDLIMDSIAAACKLNRSSGFAEKLKASLNIADKVTRHLGLSMSQRGPEITLANAHSYLQLMGKIVFSWMWLRQSIVAEKALESPSALDKESIAFYQGKVQATQYFIRWELSSVEQDAELLLGLDDTCIEMKNDWF